MPTNNNGFTVFGAIEGKWLSIGGANSRLGSPLSNETPTFDGIGRFQNFQGGVISWRPQTGAHVVWGSILARWLALGRERFGYPTTDESTTPNGLGKYNHFRAFKPDGSVIGDSSIYWTPATDAHEIYGGIREKWAATGWETSRLGFPVGPEQPAPFGKGSFQNFQGGVISWHPQTAAHIVWGGILAKWLEIGRERFGYPITDETATPDGRGRFNHFRAFNSDGSILGDSSIYWLPETGPHEIFGGIREKWAASGWERGPLGYPVDRERPTSDGIGSSQNFQGGVASWHPKIGAYIVQGLIAARWTDLGRERFGYPIRDETPTPDGRGRFNHFRAFRPDGSVLGESSIYWLPELGAHEIYGGIRERWAKRGWETSSMGYPVSAERDRSDAPGREQQFQHGRIVWSGDTGALFDPLLLTAPIVTGGLAALGGSVTLTIFLDGSIRWQGHMHDSGGDGYDFGITALVRGPSGRAIALAHTGHTGGTFTSGSRDDDWDSTSPASPYIASFLPEYNDGELSTNLNYDSSLGSTLESAVGWISKFAVGATGGTLAGAVVFVGLEVGSLISTGSLVPGAKIAEGILWMAGPGNTLFAIIAEGIASLGSSTRQLTQDEYDWANNQVFLGALPDINKLVLTDTIGPGNRAFTFPRFDGKITLNMGPQAFADPRNYSSPYGKTFIHELVHSCQIQHSKIELSLFADALATKLCEATGGDPYLYGPAGPDYSSFNLEQQAQMIGDWYAGQVPPGTNQTGIAKDTQSPYFRYVNDARLGNF